MHIKRQRFVYSMTSQRRHGRRRIKGSIKAQEESINTVAEHCVNLFALKAFTYLCQPEHHVAQDH